MGTPHNQAEKGEIAKTVLMPGDPLRAKFIAEQYLEHPVQFNEVRNMFGYTGTYNGKTVSVMGHGMGMPSIGIYSYELYHFYGVESIIRIGSAGGLAETVHVGDLIAAMGACTDSNYAAQFRLPGTFAPVADYGLLEQAMKTAKQKGLSVKVGNVISSDTFYGDNPEASAAWKKMGVLAVEMEAAALYMNAARAGKKALALLTVSDLIFGTEAMTAKEREQGLTAMIETALAVAAIE